MRPSKVKDCSFHVRSLAKSKGTEKLIYFSMTNSRTVKDNTYFILLRLALFREKHLSGVKDFNVCVDSPALTE